MSEIMKKYFIALALFLAAAPSVFGFALVGPYEDWQVNNNGYQLVGDYGGPKDISDQYRWNIPVIYYTYDPTFLTFFGTNGEAVIDQSFAVFNNLKNLSSYSSNLTEFPQNVSRANETAAQLDLLDLKSANMSMIAGLLGLNHPSRYVWNIHDRFQPDAAVSCAQGGEEYVIVQRNFDPVSQIYSSYVNGSLIDYVINDYCDRPHPNLPQSQAIGYNLDNYYVDFTAVADLNSDLFLPGLYYRGLTRDDVGGLRYLMGTNRLVLEDPSAGSLQVVTNTQTPALLITQDYGLFYQQALTNSPAALTALYPQLVILTNNLLYFSNYITAAVNYYYTNPPRGQAGYVQLASNIVYTTNLVPIYSYVFGNVQTNHAYSTVQQTITTVTYGPVVRGNAGQFYLQTNVSYNTLQIPAGDFFFFQTNACGNYAVNVNDPTVATFLLASNSYTTNLVVIATNALVTNINTTLTLSEQIVTSATTYYYSYYPTECLPTTAQVYEGVNHVQFVGVQYDPLLSTTWVPVTNIYQLTAVPPGNQPVVQTYYRVVNAPDIILESKDQVIGPAAVLFINDFVGGYLNFVNPHISADGHGPGNIVPQEIFAYAKGGGQYYINLGNFQEPLQNSVTTNGVSLTNVVAGFLYNWASFDGTTNLPVLYPTTASLAGIVSQVFFQIGTYSTPDYHVSAGYTASNPYLFQIPASGRTPPYTFTLVTNTPGSSGLPDGLTLTSNGYLTTTNRVFSVGYGVNPTNSGNTFDFNVQAKDQGGYLTQAALYINIKP
jgi:hypothetical protein